MLAEKSRRQFELDELLDINKSEEVIATDETELESGDKDSKDNEMVDENNNSKRKSMSEVVKLQNLLIFFLEVLVLRKHLLNM